MKAQRAAPDKADREHEFLKRKNNKNIMEGGGAEGERGEKEKEGEAVNFGSAMTIDAPNEVEARVCVSSS